jgi:hypothetical protein
MGFIYGSMNIFARALGGFYSDKLNIKMGMRGRLWLQSILLISEGVLIIVFALCNTLAGAVVTMCMFSLFTQSSEGAIYGVVPYVSKLYTGAVAGFVGSGGNVGSVVYGIGFRSLSYQNAFLMMGSIVIASSFLSIFIDIPCHAGMLWGEDNHAVIQARERYLRRRQMQHIAATVNSDPGHGGSDVNSEQGNDANGGTMERRDGDTSPDMASEAVAKVGVVGHPESTRDEEVPLSSG